jgi:hypothetical protein
VSIRNGIDSYGNSVNIHASSSSGSPCSVCAKFEQLRDGDRPTWQEGSPDGEKYDEIGRTKRVCPECLRAAASRDRKYKAPFSGASSNRDRCYCVSCGRQDGPKRFVPGIGLIPEGWSVRNRDGALFCWGCLGSSQHGSTDYADKNEAFTAASGSQVLYEIVVPRSTDPRRLAEIAAVQDTTLPETKKSKKKETEQKMSEKVKTQLGELGGAMAEGVKFATVDEGGEILVDMVRKLGEGSPLVAILLATEDGRSVAKVGCAVIVHGLATYTTLIPKPELVKKIAIAQITVSSLKLFQPRLKLVRKHLEQLVGIGETMAQLEAGESGALDLGAERPRVARAR